MRSYLQLCFSIISLVITMPLFASQAHPNGPKEEGFVERTIRIQGAKNHIDVTLAYPQFGDFVDHVKYGKHSVTEKNPTFLLLDFPYTGYFWQGVFGRVGLDLDVYKRKSREDPWTNWESLFQTILLVQREQNVKAQENTSNSEFRELWNEPFMSELNGVTCIQQNVTVWTRENEKRFFYFLLDEDNAVKIELQLVDNSDRPGLTKSDWRPRAESFANRLLSTVKVKRYDEAR
ncbi:hypothetical protein [Undibacterium sp.]|uniref:hypothetical protein n=1 Tax=Undibacterium sp. TaxID=1914977 RepID=UPI003751B2FF